MSMIISTNNNDDVSTSPLVIVVPCHAAPLPTSEADEQTGHRNGHSEEEQRLLRSNPLSPEPAREHRFSLNPLDLFGYDEIMDGLSDDETECGSPVHQTQSNSDGRHFVSAGASIINHSPASMCEGSNNANELMDNDTHHFYDEECSDNDGVDSMVDVDDRTYEHLFEELTVVAVDDYNNAYYAAAPLIMDGYHATYCAREGCSDAVCDSAHSTAARAIALKNVDGRSTPPSNNESAKHQQRFYTRAASDYSNPPHHSDTHTHTARNAALLKSANEKYFSSNGHLGWQWGLTIGNSAEELEEEKVWLNSFHPSANLPSDADAVPCPDCCQCGCNDFGSNLTPDVHQDYGYVSPEFAQGNGNLEFIPQNHHTYYPQNAYQQQGTLSHHLSANPTRPWRNSNSRRPDITKTERIAARSGLSQDECEARFPYYCGVKKYPTLPTRPAFPADELGVPYIKCCYYAQRPHKECSMGNKCYHTHDDEDGDKVPEVFADGKNRNEQRCPTSVLSKLSSASIAVVSKDYHKLDAVSHTDSDEIRTVPQSVCGDDQDDAHTIAGKGIYSTNCQGGKPTLITRAQLALVPCQYGARCAILHHASNAKRCGFDSEKLQRYKVYLTELRQFDSLLFVYKKARAEVRAEAAELQALEASLRSAAGEEMKSFMPRSSSSSATNSNFKWNVAAQGFTPKVRSDFEYTESSAQETIRSQVTDLQQQQHHSNHLALYQDSMPCVHCAQIGSVILRSVPMYRPNKQYDGIFDKRRELRVQGVGAYCNKCNKTFAFDDEERMHAYLDTIETPAVDHPITLEMCEGEKPHAYEFEANQREGTLIFMDPSASFLHHKDIAVIDEPISTPKYADLPW